ncbi:GAF domain-containing protein [Variovorax robiniae]|uniref:GAF domain-containing protein n=1 Tax=Variovorax robiniae TaxID=1836199 RepID=A0ABU8X0R6_9BURK
MESLRDAATFSGLLSQEGGLQSALAWLNEGVAHRYTAIYRFEGELLRNVALYDKLDQVRPEFLLVVPFRHSFCQFVLRDQAFRTEDSRLDKRLDGHPYQGVVVSYHSVPLTTGEGALWGTMSHFDMVGHPLPDEEFELLQQAALALRGHLKSLDP